MFRKLLLVVCLISNLADAYPDFLSFIPNSDIVEDPCNPRSLVKAIGHTDPNGGGSRNSFGEDFFEHRSWKELCPLDSDGDGLTNGEELGDPNCVWSIGETPEKTEHITHPGICTPVDSAACSEKNVCASRDII